MKHPTIWFSLALVLAACGGGGASTPVQTPTTIDPPQTADSPPAARPSTTVAPAVADPPVGPDLPDSDYPDIVVTDLSGGEVNLRELARETRPVLVWFWAPH